MKFQIVYWVICLLVLSLIDGVKGGCDEACNKCHGMTGSQLDDCMWDAEENYCGGVLHACDQYFVADTPSIITIQISQNTFYVTVGLIAMLVMLNISCLCVNCCRGSKKGHNYSKVDIIASSDDDIENFKEIHV